MADSTRGHKSRRGSSIWHFGRPRAWSFAPLETQEEPDGIHSRWCPEEDASWLSRLFFLYVNGLMYKGSASTSLEVDDLWDLARRDEAATVYKSFAEKMDGTKEPIIAPQGKLGSAIWKTHGWRFVAAGGMKLTHDAVMFTSPYLLEQLLHHLHQGSSRGICLGLAFALLGCKTFEALSVNAYFFILFNICLHLKSALIETIYRKSLRITLSVRTDMGVGAIVNLQSNDASKIWMLPQYLHIIWNGPFQILVVMSMLVRILGWVPAAVGLALTVAIIPVSALFNKAMEKSRKLMMVHTDARVKLVTEVITGIKAIKLYAWESPYIKKILSLRNQELEQVQRTEALSLYNSALYNMTPVLVSLAAFLVYYLQGNVVTASVAFPALALFNLLSFPIVMFPQQIMNIIHAQVSLGRIQAFLQAEEVDETPTVPAVTTKPGGKGDGPMLTSVGLMLASPEKRHGPPYIPSQVVDADASSSCSAAPSDDVPHVSADTLAVEMVNTIISSTQAKPITSPAHATVTNPASSAVTRPDDMIGKRPTTDRSITVTIPEISGHSDDFRPALDQTSLIYLDGGRYTWDKAAEPVVRDVCLRLSRSQLIMVIGRVGSGKSSLLLSILGETYKEGGVREVNGGIAYTQQDPWIMNTTLRDNVVMGQTLDEDKYSQVLEVCALLPDLEMLPAGDESEIGEKGINLSGGQKHRVALARACYADADIYLLDDPLSAVDAHVGQHLFEQCMCGWLAGKGRVLVTHQLQFLPAADLILVMDEGRVLDCGTYHELLARGLELQQLIAHSAEAGGDGSVGEEGGTDAKPQIGADSRRSIVDQGSDVPQQSDDAHVVIPSQDTDIGDVSISEANIEQQQTSTAKQVLTTSAAAAEDRALMLSTTTSKQPSRTLQRSASSGKLISAEGRSVGSVDLDVYRTYITAWGPYLILPTAMLLLALMEHTSLASQNFVLSFWSVASPKYDSAQHPASNLTPRHQPPTTLHYLLMYVSLGGIAIVLQLSRTAVLIQGSVSASRQLHSRLLSKVIRLPMQFFDSQPSGRLLNRFTKDVEVLDVQVSQSVNSGLACFTGALLSMLVILYIAPPAIAVMIPLGVLYYQVQKMYINTSREIKRLDSITTSPIFQHFSETLSGLQTIRAFRAQPLFLERNQQHLDASSRTWWPIQVFNRWLSVRLELMGALVVFFAALTVSVLLPVKAGLAGLAITSALRLTGIMNWMVRMATQLEVNMNSVERLIEYDQFEEEAPAVVEGSRPSPEWPLIGQIEARGLWVKYRPELQPVLKDLSFVVQGGEKIGVCGRTGCGKSTLMMALYRIVEPYRGSVYIDGIDTASLGLADLRGRLSLVPQDPVIFSGTVRSNLDPFGSAPNDAEIWVALRRTGMDSVVSEMGAGLDSGIKENGANLSVGQRQLLCMARALLRSSRILILDEATSNVDTATDALIQATLRSCFQGCTLLTIAHRLHTIMDADRVMVLDAGQLLEYDTPGNLLLKAGGVFKKLVEEANRQRKGAIQ